MTYQDIRGPAQLGLHHARDLLLRLFARLGTVSALDITKLGKFVPESRGLGQTKSIEQSPV